MTSTFFFWKEWSKKKTIDFLFSIFMRRKAYTRVYIVFRFTSKRGEPYFFFLKIYLHADACLRYPQKYSTITYLKTSSHTTSHWARENVCFANFRTNIYLKSVNIYFCFKSYVVLRHITPFNMSSVDKLSKQYYYFNKLKKFALFIFCRHWAHWASLGPGWHTLAPVWVLGPDSGPGIGDKKWIESYVNNKTNRKSLNSSISPAFS